MSHSDGVYVAYILRLWQVGEAPEMRFMIQNIATHEQQGFVSLEELMSYLQQEGQRHFSPQAGGHYNAAGNAAAQT